MGADRRAGGQARRKPSDLSRFIFAAASISETSSSVIRNCMKSPVRMTCAPPNGSVSQLGPRHLRSAASNRVSMAASNIDTSSMIITSK